MLKTNLRQSSSLLPRKVLVPMENYSFIRQAMLLEGQLQMCFTDNPTLKDTKAGIHPVTLLTEQKRKVILHALTSTKTRRYNRTATSTKLPNVASVSEKIEEAVSKQAGESNSVHTSLDSYGSVLTADTSQTKTGQISINRLLGTTGSDRASMSQSHNKSNLPPVKMANKPFEPKWEHYDTMRARWMYLQPQVKHLVGEETRRAPRTNQRYLEVGNEVLNGDLNDVSYYESITSGKVEKSRRVMNHTSKLLADRIERESRHYKPSPCVYY